MASIYDLKPAFQRLLGPVLRLLRSLGVTPNALTVVATLGSFAVGGWVTQSSSTRILLVFPAWLLLRMALNALDGLMARRYDMATPTGAVLNEVGDVVSDVALYASLIWVDSRVTLHVLAFVVVAALTEFCGVLSQALGAGRRYDGPMGKSDRAFWIGLWGLLATFVPRVREGLPVLLLAATLLGLFTCYQRLRPAMRGPA